MGNAPRSEPKENYQSDHAKPVETQERKTEELDLKAFQRYINGIAGTPFSLFPYWHLLTNILLWCFWFLADGFPSRRCASN